MENPYASDAIHSDNLVNIEPLIRIIRNQQVILDSDLALLYGVETKRLNEQVKRNIDRFPDDFMFQLNKEEAEASRSQFATLNKRDKNVKARIYTKQISQKIKLDIARHNAQYPPIEIEVFKDAHDRFLCIDDVVYHFGASIKDLGKKWFGFNRMEQTTDMLLARM